MKKTDAQHTPGKHGIRSRVSLYLLLFAGGIILLLWLFQIVLLDSFYRFYRTGQVTRAAEFLAASASVDEMAERAEETALDSDVCILLLDAGANRLVSAEGTRNCLIHRMTANDLQRWCARAAESGTAITRLFSTGPALGGEGRPGRLSGGGSQPLTPDGEEALTAAQSEPKNTYTPRGGRDRSGGFFGFGPEADNAMTLIYARAVTLADGTAGTLLLNTQITPVSSTVNTLRAQLVVITILVLLGAAGLSAVISWRVSRPIIETNEAARELARARYTRPGHADSYREIAELNTTLEKAAAELGQVEGLQHELIANISHDLRTPLTMIGGYAEAMRDIPGENTPQNMQIIIDETARLTTLVNELLDFSRVQTGSVPMKPEAFDLTASAAAIVTRVGKLVAKDGYTVVFEPEESLTVTADPTRIGQVIYNLIGNALTYTGEDKTVIVRQSRREDRARIEVRDSGPGIAADELPLIWNRYYRTKETHRRAIIGSGLGLNIVRTILEQHGAPYGVTSAEGQGTTFWFELSLADSEAGAGPAPSR